MLDTGKLLGSNKILERILRPFESFKWSLTYPIFPFIKDVSYTQIEIIVRDVDHRIYSGSQTIQRREKGDIYIDLDETNEQ